MTSQDFLDNPSLCSFTNGSSKDKIASMNKAGVFCEVTFFCRPSMSWRYWGCKFAIHSYNNVLAIVGSNKSLEVPHSIVQGNENWWGVDDIA